MNQYLSIIKGFNKDLKLFYGSTAMQGFIFFGIYSLLLNLYLLRLGYDASFIGTVNGVGPIVLAVGSIPAGLLSKRIGSRKGLIIGYFFAGVGFALLPLSHLGPSSWQDTWIVSSYAFSWLFAALLIANFGPFVMSQTTEQERNYAFAIMSGLFPVAGFLGNFVGGFLPGFFANLSGQSLQDATPYRNALFLGALLYLIPSFLIWLTSGSAKEPAPATTQNRNKSKPPIRLMLAVATVSLLIIVGDWTLQLYLNVYLDTVLKVPTALIGTVMGAGRLLGLTAFLAPFAMGRWGLKQTLFFSAVAAALTFIPLILIGHWLAAGISFMALTAASSILNPTFNRFSQSLIDIEWRTTMASAVSTSTGIAIAITAFGGSSIILSFNFQTLFIVAASIMLFGAGLIKLFFRETGQATPAIIQAPAD